MMLANAFLATPIAHRGLHDRERGVIENSRAAVAAAIAGGYGIEIDVQRAACGTPMVFHDDQLSRLTGRAGALRDLDAEALGAIRLTGCDEGIPTLAEILAVVAGRAPLLVEIKDQDGAQGPAIGDLHESVARLLEGYAGPVAVMSFNPHIVAAFAAAAPAIARGTTTDAYRADDWPELPEARRQELKAMAGAEAHHFISHGWRDLRNPRVAKIREHGLPVLCWTIRSAEEEAEARKVADNVTFEGYRP